MFHVLMVKVKRAVSLLEHNDITFDLSRLSSASIVNEVQVPREDIQYERMLLQQLAAYKF